MNRTFQSRFAGVAGARTAVIPRAADEFTMLKAYLEHFRETFELKCAGVDPARLSERSSPPSTMSLHGLVRHFAGGERWWFATNFAGLGLPMLYYSDDDPDLDFEGLAGDPLEDLATWRPSASGPDGSLMRRRVWMRSGQSSETAATPCAG